MPSPNRWPGKLGFLLVRDDFENLRHSRGGCATRSCKKEKAAVLVGTTALPPRHAQNQKAHVTGAPPCTAFSKMATWKQGRR